MHSGVRVRTVTEATPCRTKPARSVSPAAIGSRSHAAQTQNRIEKLVALATTLALGLGAGTANADTVSSSGMASSSASASTLTDQALDAGNSTIVVSKEAPSVAGGGAGIPTAGMEGAMAKTVTTADPTAQAGATEGKAEAKKPAGRRGRIKELEDIKDECVAAPRDLQTPRPNLILTQTSHIRQAREERAGAPQQGERPARKGTVHLGPPTRARNRTKTPRYVTCIVDTKDDGHGLTSVWCSRVCPHLSITTITTILISTRRPELVTKEKEDAEEEALLSKSLCTGSTMLP